MSDPICNERGIPQSDCPPFCPHDFGMRPTETEQLRDARDRAERQAGAAESVLATFADYVADHPCDDPECEKLRANLGLIDDASEPDCPGLCGEHHWLDRPESDTRECLICGTETSG